MPSSHKSRCNPGKTLSLLDIPPGRTLLRVLPDYAIQFEQEPYIVLVTGALLNAAAMKFAHRNVVGRRCTVHEFKHYAKSGRKWWTRHAGVDMYMVVPKTAVQVVAENGYSYPKIVIGGKQLQLNVSGGTGAGGWLDWVGTRAATSVNLPVTTLKAIAGCAWNAEQCRAAGIRLVFKPLDQSDHDYLAAVVAAPAARHNLQPGQTVQLTQPYECFGGSTAVLKQLPPGTSLICAAPQTEKLYRLKADQVDWVATCRLNHIDVVLPDEFNLLAPQAGDQLVPEANHEFADLVTALCSSTAGLAIEPVPSAPRQIPLAL